MKFNDINAWAKLINEAQEKEEAWNEACEKAQIQAKELEEQEFNELDEKTIDPKTLGFGECCEEDIIDDDDNDCIDFSAYGITEADEREPLVVAAKALGADVPSTADLTGENSVQLRIAEALEKLTGELSKKRLSEADDDDENDENIEGGEDIEKKKKDLEFFKKREFSTRPGMRPPARIAPSRSTMSDEDFAKIEKHAQDIAAEIKDEEIAAQKRAQDLADEIKQEAQKAGGNLPAEALDALSQIIPPNGDVISDADWEKIESMNTLDEKVKFMQELVKNAPNEDVRKQIRDYVEDVVTAATKQKEKDENFQWLLRMQAQSFVNDVDEMPDELKQEFIDRIAKLDDYEKSLLQSNLMNLEADPNYSTVFVMHRPGDPDPNQGKGNRTEEDAERADPYGEGANLHTTSGLDAEKARRAKREDDWRKAPYQSDGGTPGQEIPYQYNPDYESVYGRGKRMQRDADQLSRNPFIKVYGDNERIDRITSAVKHNIIANDRGSSKSSNMTVRDFRDLIWGMTPEDAAALKAELFADVQTPGEREALKTIFSGKMTQQQFLEMIGVTSDKSGAATQQQDKWINQMLYACANELLISDDDQSVCYLMKAANNAQSTMKANTDMLEGLNNLGDYANGYDILGANNKINCRQAIKACRRYLFDRVCEELDVDPVEYWKDHCDTVERWKADVKREAKANGMKANPKVTFKLERGLRPDGDGDLAQKRAFDWMVVDLLYMAFEENLTDAETIRAALKDFSDTRERRKTDTYLNPQQHERFIMLANKAIDNPREMTDGEAVELVALDYAHSHKCRFEDAEQFAMDKVTDPKTGNLNSEAFAEFLKKVAQTFFAGKSRNYGGGGNDYKL